MAMTTVTRRRPSKGASKSRAKAPGVGKHQHHWVIESPSGPTSVGRCEACGRTRRFPNSSEDSIWDGADGRSRWNDMGIARRRRAQDEPIVGENVVAV